MARRLFHKSSTRFRFFPRFLTGAVSANAIFLSTATLYAATLCASTLCAVKPTRAATLRVSPAGAQPGDVLTLTVYPAAGETLTALSMTAFDTKDVKFYVKKDGTARGFVGLPFDRHGGVFTLKALVKVSTLVKTRVGTPDLVESTQTLSTRFAARERVFPTQRISMNSSTAGKMNEKAAFAAEKARVQSTMQNSHDGPLWHGNWLTPTAGASTSAYGRRRYVNGRWWGQHNGADVKAPSGAPVRASNSGRVVLSEYLPTLRGNCIVVDHGCNVFSVYMHLSKRLASVGQSVQKGQLIGRVGATGFVTGPHLHWEIRVGWEPCDPNHVVAYGLNF